MNKYKNEKDHLSKIAQKTQYSDGFNGKLMYYRHLTLQKFFHGEIALELGCADGLTTEMLVQYFKRIVVVDGSERYCQMTRNRVPSKSVEIHCSLFEEFKTEEKFDTIIMAHILEHIQNPIDLLRKIKEWIKNDGVILIDVPNANSIHRAAGIEMGLLKNVTELNELDHSLGHRRVYTPDTLKNDILSAGLKIIKTGGIFLKPLTNKQMEDWFSDSMTEAFYKLGDKYPEIAGEIYAVCSK